MVPLCIFKDLLSPSKKMGLSFVATAGIALGTISPLAAGQYVTTFERLNQRLDAFTRCIGERNPELPAFTEITFSGSDQSGDRLVFRGELSVVGGGWGSPHAFEATFQRDFDRFLLKDVTSGSCFLEIEFNCIDIKLKVFGEENAPCLDQ
ncbi:MAG: hypothetical protein ACFCBW_03845 [Candidatus Competibacterales bacterium]